MKKFLLFSVLSIFMFSNAYSQTTITIDHDSYKSSSIELFNGFYSPAYFSYVGKDQTGYKARGALYYSLPSGLWGATITASSLEVQASTNWVAAYGSIQFTDLGSTGLPLPGVEFYWDEVKSSDKIGSAFPITYEGQIVTLNHVSLKDKIVTSINLSEFYCALGVYNVYETYAGVRLDPGPLSITFIPAPPTSLSFSNVSTTGFTVNWPASYGASGYQIYKNGVLQTTTASTNYTFSGLAPGTNYTIGVKAYSGSQASAMKTGTKRTLCIAPQNLTANIHSYSWITLNWTASYGASGYSVFYNNNIYTIQVPYVDIYGTSPGTTYTFEVWATNSSGSSAHSLITVTTPGLKSGSLDNSMQNNDVEQEINIYPNPASDYLYLINGSNSDVTIYDLRGNKVLHLTNISSESIDISSLKNGLYFIEIKNDGLIFKEKFIKE